MNPVLLPSHDPCRTLRRRLTHTGRGAVSLWLSAVVLVMYLACVPAVAVTEAELIGPDLVARPVKITNLHDGTLNYFDENRTLQSASVDGFVQLRAIGGQIASDPAPYPCISLTDGQRFTGSWIGPTPDGSGLRWRNDLVGTLVISLDEVASITWLDNGPTDATNETSATDTLILINGDVLRGFVSALTDQGVALIPEAGTAPVSIPYRRIAALNVANPMLARVDTVNRVTLVDGTRVLADDVRWSGDQASWLVTPPGAPPIRVQTSLTDLARIDFGAGGFRLIDLSELPMRIQTDPDVFGLALPVRIQGRLIRAHAPATLAFDLPLGTVRFAATAELDTTDAPDHVNSWADFHVVVSSGATEAGRGHVTGAQPVSRINTPISGRELTIRLEPGVNGPILDRLRLRHAVILLQIPPTGRTHQTDR